MKKTKLDGIKKVIFFDDTEYVYEKSNDGGCYSFWEEYYNIGGGKWQLRCGTSADFEYCPVCGSFENHYNYDNEKYNCGDFEVITESELLKRINNFEETEKKYIKYIYPEKKVYKSTEDLFAEL